MAPIAISQTLSFWTFMSNPTKPSQVVYCKVLYVLNGQKKEEKANRKKHSTAVRKLNPRTLSPDPRALTTWPRCPAITMAGHRPHHFQIAEAYDVSIFSTALKWLAFLCPRPLRCIFIQFITFMVFLRLAESHKRLWWLTLFAPLALCAVCCVLTEQRIF